MKLKPCPFCGGEATIWSGPINEDYFNTYYDVYCTACNCMTPKFHTEESAVTFWNRREPIEKIVEQLAMNSHRVETHEYGSERVVRLIDAIYIVKGIYEEISRGEFDKAIEIVKSGGAENDS